MVSRIRRHVAGNAYGLLAVFIALGGTTYAATQLPKNSVGPKQIEKGAVKAPEVAKNAVRSAEVKANAIGTGEVADASLLSEDFAPGQLPQGPPGEPGAPGAPGADATKVFGYIRDPGPGLTENAVLQYGNGITNVQEEPGNGLYTVTFDRNLANCVAVATPGIGEPQGGNAEPSAAAAFLEMHPTAILVSMLSPLSHNPVDTSFLITVFC